MLATKTRSPWWAQYQVKLPEGCVGKWRVERFTVTAEAAAIDRIRAIRSGRCTPEGTYTRLMRGGYLVMSDTPDEISDHTAPIHRATGNVLINGLGLGMVLKAVLAKPDVRRVDVVEIDADVIALVGKHYVDDRLTIHHANAYTFTPPKGVRWQVVWHDIWDDICSDNLDGMSKLHRKYGRRSDWQWSWCRSQCERRRGSMY